MTLAAPRLEYKTIRDDIIALLRANINTINLDLTNAFSQVTLQMVAGDPVYTFLDNPLYPMIYVKVVRKAEQFRELGHAGRKIPSVEFKIFGICRNLKSKQDADNEIMLLARNIEGVFRDNIDLAAPADILYSSIGGAEFAAAELDREYLIDVVAIDITVYAELK